MSCRGVVGCMMAGFSLTPIGLSRFWRRYIVSRGWAFSLESTGGVADHGDMCGFASCLVL